MFKKISDGKAKSCLQKVTKRIVTHIGHQSQTRHGTGFLLSFYMKTDDCSFFFGYLLAGIRYIYSEIQGIFWYSVRCIQYVLAQEDECHNEALKYNTRGSSPSCRRCPGWCPGRSWSSCHWWGGSPAAQIIYGKENLDNLTRKSNRSSSWKSLQDYNEI